MVDHNIRKDSNKEARKVKDLLKKKIIFLNILFNKEKINRNIQAEARKLRYEILQNHCKKNKINTVIV